MDTQLRKAITSGSRSFWIPVAAFVAFIAIAFLFLQMNRDLPFDSAQWKTEEHLRPRMVRNLLDKHPIVGLPREDVIAMLGQPKGRDSIRGNNYFYWAGTDGLIDDVWLEIEFKNDIAIDSRYVPD